MCIVVQIDTSARKLIEPKGPKFYAAVNPEAAEAVSLVRGDDAVSFKCGVAIPDPILECAGLMCGASRV
jgi:hypothetical protein